MKILLFGGTTEGRLLAQKLADSGYEVTVSVATKLGAEELQGIPVNVACGKVTRQEMPAFVAGYDLVIDATHPYAREVTENIREACGKKQVPLRRVLRSASDHTDCVQVKDHEQAAVYLKERTGNILLTVGSRELDRYRSLESNRLYARVLPTHEALELCEKAGIGHRNILALQGPFSTQMNIAMIRQYEIRYLVTKDGGEAGGFREKKEAADECGIELILVQRPQEQGITMEELLGELEGTK